MMNTRFISVTWLAALLGIGLGVGCGLGSGASSDEMSAELIACHLNDGTVEHNAQLRACDPQDQKKTTICHIPPGNPANAHTLCIGNAGVPSHLRNHGDYLGPCRHETPCPPPAVDAGGPGGAGGGAGGGGAAGSADDGGIITPI
jgi:hypothetical protein